MGSTEGFFAAIDAGDAELVRSMVVSDPSLASARDEQGLDDRDAAELRRRRRSRGRGAPAPGAGADPNARQASGWTLLHSAAHNGDRELVELLLAGGANPAATNDGVSVLSMAEEVGTRTPSHASARRSAP